MPHQNVFCRQFNSIHVLIDHIPKHEKVTSNNKNNFFSHYFRRRTLRENSLRENIIVNEKLSFSKH